MATKDASVEASGKRGIQTVRNAAKILKALAKLGEASNLRAVSQASGLSNSQAHRYLRTLMSEGMAHQDPETGRYDLGPGAITVGLAALSRTDALRTAEVGVAAYVRQTGLSAQVSALGPRGPTIIRWYSGVPPVVTPLGLGSVLSMLRSASGNVFIAFSPEAEVDPLIERELAHDAHSRVNVELLRRKVRKQGFASISGTVAPGLRASAFPIFDLQGRLILTATVMMSEAFDPADDPRIREEFGQVCADISASVGGHPPPEAPEQPVSPERTPRSGGRGGS
jgi:DNA-binding IclR family transcriptional regulator